LTIDTDQWSLRYRKEAVDVDARKLLITNYLGTEQEKDLTVPPNCSGFGRIRHFDRTTSTGWPPNPLPIEPATRALGLEPVETLEAQAFQNAVCNWRCWYCYVPFQLLSANLAKSSWLSASDLIELYLQEDIRPKVIDLTGGQPDLVPEWVPWMMEELRDRGIDSETYLWSDDNLGNDYFSRFLSETQLELVSSYPNYGRVGCFKGFDEESFTFNTLADADVFGRQFQVMARLISLGIDMYAYVTLTTPSRNGVKTGIRRFVERLQLVDSNLPLRTVPLEIRMFTPVYARVRPVHEEALENQKWAVEAWMTELEERFSSEERSQPITDVAIGSIRELT
jgi:uncharacterized Fe-S cluster-containing radical SAM superfamily protein